jgi:hypothetical protein
MASSSDPDLHAWPSRAGKRGHVGWTLTLWLRRPALIRLLIRQEAPSCRVWGTLERHGERGFNRVRFVGRLHGKRLPPGTYRIRAEAVRGENEKALGTVTVVIPSRSREVQRLRPQKSTCDSAISEVADEEADAADALLRTGGGSGGDEPEEVAAATAEAEEERPRVAAGGNPPPHKDDTSFGGTLPNPFAEAPGWLQPFMFGMLAVALILLQLGMLPVSVIPSGGAAAFVARRRPALVGAGAGLLGALGVAALTL